MHEAYACDKRNGERQDYIEAYCEANMKVHDARRKDAKTSGKYEEEVMSEEEGSCKGRNKED